MGPLPVWGWVALCCVLGAALRVMVALRVSMWIDDGATLHAIRLPPGELVAERFRMGHLPLFFLLFKGWSALAGEGLLALRLPSLIACTAAIPLVAALAGRIGGARAAVIAAALAMVHGTLLRFSAELRMYSWLALLGGAMMLAALRHAERPTAGRAAALGVLHLAMLQMHVSALLWTAPFFALLGLLMGGGGRSRAWWLGVGTTFLAPLMITAPMLVYLRSKVDMGQFSKFEHGPEWRDLLQHPYELVMALGATAKGGHVWKLPLGFVVPALAVALIARLNRGGDGAAPQVRIACLYALAALLPPVVAFVVSKVGVPVLGEPRYYIAGTGPLLALVGAGAAACRIERDALGRALLIVAIMVGIVAGERAYDRTRRVLTGEGVGINKLVRDIEGQVPPGSVVALSHSVAFPDIAYYYFQKPLRYDFVEIDRDATRAEIHALLAPHMRPDRDSVLFLYKMTPDRLEEDQDAVSSNLYRVVEGDFGPWAGVTRSKDDEPGYFWFRRAGHEAP